MTEEPTVPLWICTCCYVLLVNGDACVDCCDTNRLLSQFEGVHVTPGMLAEYHTDSYGDPCNRNEYGECDCETNSFSWSACDGCGSNLGGARYAATGWLAVSDS